MLSEIALGLASIVNIAGGKALNGLGAERLLNPIKLRMPDNADRESDSVR